MSESNAAAASTADQVSPGHIVYLCFLFLSLCFLSLSLFLGIDREASVPMFLFIY